MRKLLALLLTLTLLGASVSALALSAPGELPLITEPETLTIGLQQHALTTDYENNDMTQLIEQTTGVQLDFVMFPTDANEAKQKLSLMVAAEQTLPDILQLGLSDIERATYGASGIFIPLNDYLANDAYYWNLAMDTWTEPGKKEEILKYGTSPDGNLYGYPSYYVDPGDATALGMWINKTWLDNLGLEVPTTTEELYDVLCAFRDQDANGNGDAGDEIPLVGHKEWMGNAPQYLMNSFVYDAFAPNFGYQFNVTDGKLWAPFVTDAYREGLRYLTKLGKEGLLSPLSFSQTSNELRAILSAPNDQVSLVGAFVGHPSPIFGVALPEEHGGADGTVERVKEYMGLPAMIGPEGIQWSPFSGQMAGYSAYITSDCANPTLAFRTLDAVALQDISISMRYGVKDVDWIYTSEGEVNHRYLEGFHAIYQQTPTTERPVRWTSENNTIWHINAFNMLPPKLFAGLVSAGYNTPLREYQMLTLWYSTVPLRYFAHPDELAVKLIYTQEEADGISEIEASLRSYVDESLARFTLGDMDVEKDWETYLATLDSIGLEYYIGIAQQAYDRMNAE
ncbi:MAG TPA: extracellular solute-binding protein [Clostridia bacterium]|nr:extracellular solute-binding protein [Clostridia bacterium]